MVVWRHGTQNLSGMQVQAVGLIPSSMVGVDTTASQDALNVRRMLESKGPSAEAQPSLLPATATTQTLDIASRIASRPEHSSIATAVGGQNNLATISIYMDTVAAQYRPYGPAGFQQFLQRGLNLFQQLGIPILNMFVPGIGGPLNALFSDIYNKGPNLVDSPKPEDLAKSPVIVKINQRLDEQQAILEKLRVKIESNGSDKPRVERLLENDTVESVAGEVVTVIREEKKISINIPNSSLKSGDLVIDDTGSGTERTIKVVRDKKTQIFKLTPGGGDGKIGPIPKDDPKAAARELAKALNGEVIEETSRGLVVKKPDGSKIFIPWSGEKPSIAQ
ncbi:MAG: hypothetical protein U0800_14345 [Isosphaeraceae bacterium]